MKLSRYFFLLGLSAVCGLFPGSFCRSAWIWVEGEKPTKSTMNRHPWWYDQVQRDKLSGGDLISNFHPNKAGEAEYDFIAPEKGSYEFWVRANPLQARLSYKLNEGEWTLIDLDKNPVGNINIAPNNVPDLRFLVWVEIGKVPLKKGENRVSFRMHSKNSNHGYLDCFVFSQELFVPRGTLKPNEKAKANKKVDDDRDWFPFEPRPTTFAPESVIDLRFLNEKEAGENGFIAAKGGQFVHSRSGKPVRFWAVNGAPGKNREALRKEARLLAKYGINMVRVHGALFDEKGEVDPLAITHAFDIVDELKAEGIYTHFSTYFPLWLRPKPGTPWLGGYDGQKLPFASLFFNKDFQKQYQGWFRAFLTTPNPKNGKRLIDEPALASLELVNEDSYFFWTFNTDNIPDTQLRILETQFGDWLKKKYGSLDATFEKWQKVKVPRDKPEEGRVSFRALWNIAHDKTQRDKDTASFLLDSQRGFYQETYRFLRDIGFKGLITASNWITADPQFLGPLEKYSYTVVDFIDRHGYFGCNHQGNNAGWSVQNEHTYSDRSALKFDSEEPGKPKVFAHPAMDPSYDGKPSMISETAWNRPNRFRSEAPLFFAAYGALQDSDAIVFFAFDSPNWTVKPNYFMQPWTVASPATMGQFPAAALIYRQGLVATGDLLADLNLKIQDILDLKGTPLPQDAAFDELRAKDVPTGKTLAHGNVIDPLIHLSGRTNVTFTRDGGPAQLRDLTPFIDRANHSVKSSTGEISLDYGKGLLKINAPAAQGASGNVRDAGVVELRDIAVSSPLALVHIVAVALDGQPLKNSHKILLQAMTEEKASEFRTEPAGQGVKRIVSIGQDPWLVKKIEGTVQFKRPDASQLKVFPLDANGNPSKEAGSAAEIKLKPETVYYLITP